MYFNKRNIIILSTLIIFTIYLALPAPIILVTEKNNKPTCCPNCVTCNL